MPEQQTVTPRKRRGPVQIGKGTLFVVRMQPEQLAAVNNRAASEDDVATRPEAVRRLAARGLAT